MKYLGLLSPGLQVFFFEKFVKPSSPSSYILNVRSLIRFEQMRKGSVSLKTINTLESFKSL